MAGDEEEEALAFEPEDVSALDCLSAPEGQVYFYPDVQTFAEERGASAVMYQAGAVWLLPQAGGKWKNVEDWKKDAAPTRAIRAVK